MAINPEIHTFFTIYMLEEVSSINYEWRNSSTPKPSKLVTVRRCQGQDIIHQISSNHDFLQQSAKATTHQALAPSAPILFHSKLMFVTEAFIFSASATAWKQRQIKVGVWIWVLQTKPDNLNSKKKITFNWQLTKACRISLIQKTQDDPDINTLFQHLHVWHPSSFRDEP